MIVADTNILLYLLLKEQPNKFSAQAEQLLRKHPNWLLPGLWRHEFLNALATGVRHRVMTETSAINAWLEALGTFSDCEGPLDQTRALELSCRLSITAYDAQYLTLAEAANIPLVTQDEELLSKAPDIAISLSQALALT